MTQDSAPSPNGRQECAEEERPAPPSTPAAPPPAAQAAPAAPPPLAPTAPAAQTPTALSPAEKFFSAASRAAPLFLVLLLAAQAWPVLMGHNLYCPREAIGIGIYAASVKSGLWLAPAGAELVQWPAFFWFLGGMGALLAKAAPAWGQLLFPLAALGGALLTLLAVWALCRVAGLNREESLAGGMLLLCTPLFAPLPGYLGPEGLAAALTLLSLACLCHGWQQARAFVSLPLGFVLAGLAGLTGGLFHLLLPLAASVVFLFWRGSFRRAQGLDGVAGFVLLLLLVAGWLGGVMLWQQPEGYLKLLGARLILWPWPAATWWKPLLLAAAGLLPWLAVAACVSWARVLRTAPQDLLASRKDRAGLAFLWIALVLGCLLSLLAYETVGAALCLVALAAPLLGKALLRLPPLGSRLFYIVSALCLLHAGMALAAAGFGLSLDWMGRFFHFSLTPEQRTAVLGLKALPLLGGLCIAAAVLLARLVRRNAHGGTRGALLICACMVVLLAQPARLLLAPQLEQVTEARLKSLEAIMQPQTPAAPAVPAAPANPSAKPEAPTAPAPPAIPPAASEAPAVPASPPASEILPPPTPPAIPAAPPAAPEAPVVPAAPASPPAAAEVPAVPASPAAPETPASPPAEQAAPQAVPAAPADPVGTAPL